MKLLVIGATGATGTIIVRSALERGNQVTAMARNPADVSLEHPKLRVVKADVLQLVSLEAAVQGQDAVVFAAGSGNMKRSTLRTEGARNTVAAMQKAGVRRLVAMSGLGAGDSLAGLPLPVRAIIVPLLLGRLIADQNGLEEIIRRSDLDWTLVRPGELRDRPGQGSCDTSLDGRGISARVSRADVANFIVDELERSQFVRMAPGLGYRKKAA